MKKGQAAMEFLMTYGWAILVVIAAIAALAYFGVLDPARLLPERCQFPAGIDCIDKPAIDGTADTVTLAFRNNIGFTMQVDSVASTAGSCSGATQIAIGASGSLQNLPQNVSNNGVFRIQLSGCSLNTGDKFDGDVTVTYTNMETGLQNKAVGDVRGRVG
jgi:hypothetical protein